MNLLERLAKMAMNPFNDWSYTSMGASPSTSSTTNSIPQHNPPPLAPMVTIPKDPAIQSGIDGQSFEPVRARPGPKRGGGIGNSGARKRPYEDTMERTITPEPKIMRDMGANKSEQVGLHEFYYATMQPTKSPDPGKENKITFTFKVSVYS